MQPGRSPGGGPECNREGRPECSREASGKGGRRLSREAAGDGVLHNCERHLRARLDFDFTVCDFYDIYSLEADFRMILILANQTFSLSPPSGRMTRMENAILDKEDMPCRP